MQRAPALALLAAAVAVESTAVGQSPLPDPHWGGFAFPSPTREIRTGMSVNRFTQFDADGDTYNEIAESAGFNIFFLSYTDRLAALPEWSFTASLGAGWSDDQPSEWLQNNVVHGLRNQAEVRVGEVREEAEFAGGLALTRWFEPTVGSDVFFGGGVASGTLYHEPYLYGGYNLLFDGPRIRASVLGRVSRPIGGEAYPEVATYNALLQGALAYVPERIESSTWVMQMLGNPEIGIALTYDTGLFVDIEDDPIDTVFVSLRVQWATGLVLETWNDIANGSDFGPTFGATFSVDLSTFFDLDH
jgi:hypothetical protein